MFVSLPISYSCGGCLSSILVIVLAVGIPRTDIDNFLAYVVYAVARVPRIENAGHEAPLPRQAPSSASVVDSVVNGHIVVEIDISINNTHQKVRE